MTNFNQKLDIDKISNILKKVFLKFQIDSSEKH